MSRSPTLSEVIRLAIDTRLVDVHTSMPGRIESYDAATQKADVQPLLKREQQAIDGDLIETLPIIPSVPVAFPRFGDHRITFPVAKGDFCVLMFSEASIDAVQASQSGQPVDPGTYERHNLSDAIAHVGWAPDSAALAPTDADDITIGKDGGAAIHIGRDMVNLYTRDAADFVALADKVKSELTRIEDYFKPILLLLGGTPIISEPGSGSPSAFQAALAVAITGGGNPVYPAPVAPAASKVKAT